MTLDERAQQIAETEYTVYMTVEDGPEEPQAWCPDLQAALDYMAAERPFYDARNIPVSFRLEPVAGTYGRW